MGVPTGGREVMVGSTEGFGNTLSTTTLDSPPLHFEQLAAGDQWWSPFREVSGEDVSQFALLTGDDDPLHTEAAVESPFGEPVAHGLLGLSIMAGLSCRHPRVATLALVEIEQWRFESPIFFGDRVRVMTEVASVSPHGRRAGRVVWVRQLVNQDGRVVQRGRIISLVAKANRGGRGRGHETSDEMSMASSDGVDRRSLPPR